MNQLNFVHGAPLLLLILGFLFAFSNGFRDSSSIVATVVSTRTLAPNAAFSLCAAFEFVGALLIGSAVASTVRNRIFSMAMPPTQQEVVLTSIAALCAAGVWGFISWWRAWPTSNGHALLGGLTGAGSAAWGVQHIQNKTVFFIGFILLASPVIGFLVSYGVTSVLRWLGGWFTKKAKPITDGMHILSCMAVSCAHGSNDGQLVIGVLLPVLGGVAGAAIPFSLRFAVALALSLGVLFGGRRILKKLGMKFYRIQDTQGLSVDMTTAGTVMACAVAGFPASTTQVIAGSLMGAAVAKNARRARWQVAQEVATSWLVTFPMAALLAYVAYDVICWTVGVP